MIPVSGYEGILVGFVFAKMVVASRQCLDGAVLMVLCGDVAAMEEATADPILLI